MAVFFSTKTTGPKNRKKKKKQTIMTYAFCMSEDSWFLFHEAVSQSSGFLVSNLKYSFSKRTELTIYCFY